MDVCPVKWPIPMQIWQYFLDRPSTHYILEKRLRESFQHCHSEHLRLYARRTEDRKAGTTQHFHGYQLSGYETRETTAPERATLTYTVSCQHRHTEYDCWDLAKSLVLEVLDVRKKQLQ